MKQHITYFDFLRGVAILMVVAIHTPYVLGDFTTIDGIARILFRQTLNCAVPIFLALSGFFLGRKTFDSRNSVLSFWKKQIPKVYIPCIVWSLPLLVFSILGGASVWKQVVYLIVCGFSIYYFISLIIQYYLLLPFLQRHLKRNLIISIFSSVVSISIITFLLSVKGVSLPLILYAGPFVVWFVFYMLGVYYSRKPRNYSLKVCIAIVLVGLLLEFIETYFLNTQYSGGLGIKLSAFIYSFGIVLLILHPKVEASFKENTLINFIIYVGKISFGIYLIHGYMMIVVDKLITTDIWFFRWIMVSLASVVVIAIVRKILPQNVCKYIGFS